MGNFARDKPGPGLNLGKNSCKVAAIFWQNFYIYRIDHLLSIVFNSIRGKPPLSTRRFDKNVLFLPINCPFPICFDIIAGVCRVVFVSAGGDGDGG